MKQLVVILICLIQFCGLMAQDTPSVAELNNVNKGETVAEGQAVIYGVFIQRLDKKSKGYPQYICIEDTKTLQRYMFKVKPAMKSDKENIFCAHIPSGTYRIISYYWVVSNWYGGTAHNEPVYKGIKVDKNFNRLLHNGQVKEEDLQTYTFTIRPDMANYLGRWNFGVEPATFDDDKETLDSHISELYPAIDFSIARKALPF